MLKVAQVSSTWQIAMIAVLLPTLLTLTPPPTPGSHHYTRAAVLRSTAAAAAAAAAAANRAPTAFAMPPVQLLQEEQQQQATQQEVTKVLYTPPTVKSASSKDELALADHLKSTGAKFYGAYWCSFCLRQRTMFGADAAKALPYVECADDGLGSVRCPPQVTGYPAWQIGGKFYAGMRSLQDLQSISGFDPSVTFPAPPPPPARPPPPPGGYKPPAVAGASTTEQLALAKHLQSTGAKFFGAYWCKYCGLQRTLFGAEGAAALPYVECASDGFESASGTCAAASEVSGYPTWQIGGSFYSGYQSLEELARLSGFQAPTQPVPAAAVAASAKPTAADDLGIDFSGAAPPVRQGADCDLKSGDCP